MSDALLQVRDLRVGYGNKNPYEVVHGISFDVDRGEFVCIIGANACGKTTSVKALMGLLPVMGGSVRVSGVDIRHLPEQERAKHYAYIPQAHTPPFPFSVADVVLMGRTPYINKFSRTTEYDRAVAYSALELMGITEIAEKHYTKLSGGQQQLVLIARALAQQSNILIMDEPTASLDYGNQHMVLSSMRNLSKLGKSVVMVTHDPDHALYCADRVIVMDAGTILCDGTPDECITADVLNHIYGVGVKIMDIEVDPGQTERICIPMKHEDDEKYDTPCN